MIFYVLDTPVGESKAEMDYYDYDVGHSNLGEALRCPSCNNILSSLTWKKPYRVEIKFWGRKYGEVARLADYLLLSERLVKLYLKEKLTGLKILGPAEIVKVVPRRMMDGLPMYYIGGARRSKTIFDDVASEAEWETPWTCETCREGDDIQRIKRVVIKEETWEGEDLFYARGLPGTIIASERFKEFVDRHQILNAKLIEASKYSFDFYPKEDTDKGNS